MCSHYYGGVNICDMRLCVLRPGVCLRIANTVVPKSRPTKRAFILHIGPQSVRRNFAQRANLEFRDGSPMLFCSLAYEEEKTPNAMWQATVEDLSIKEKKHLGSDWTVHLSSEVLSTIVATYGVSIFSKNCNFYYYEEAYVRYFLI